VNRPGGIPLIAWIGALALGVGGYIWFRKKGSSAASPATAAKTATPSFTQAQEVQDFQIFSALTSAQQGSDLNFLTEVAGLFGGGSSTGTTGNTSTNTNPIPSPANVGTVAPATVPASSLPAAVTP